MHRTVALLTYSYQRRPFCLFSKCVDRGLNFKEIYFVMNHLKHWCYFYMNYTALGESPMTNIVLNFTSRLTLSLYISHKLAAVV